MKSRQLLFLRDTLFYTFSAFGGPQAHVAILLREFVEKRRYVTEEELMELMTQRRFRHVPVEEKGKLSGIISIGDVVKSRIKQIEQEAEQIKAYIAG